MNPAKLVNFLPMLVMLVSLGYAAYTVQGLGSNRRAHVEPGRDEARRHEGRRTRLGCHPHARGFPRIADTVRDPFQVVAKPVPEPVAKAAASDQTPTPSDPHAGLVHSLTLNATLLQGRTQLAVINGRIYNAGQHLNDRQGQPSPLSLAKIFAQKVILEAGGKHYVLAYPDNFDGPHTANQ